MRKPTKPKPTKPTWKIGDRVTAQTGRHDFVTGTVVAIDGDTITIDDGMSGCILPAEIVEAA